MTDPKTTVEQYTITRDACETLRATLPDFTMHSVTTWDGPEDWQDVATRYADALEETLTQGWQSRDVSLYVLPADVNLAPESYAPDNDLPEFSAHRDELAQLEEMGFLSTRTLISDDASGSYLSDDRRVIAVTVHHAFKVQPVAYRWNDRAPIGAYAIAGWDVKESLPTVPAGVYLLGQSGNAYRMDTDVTVYVGPEADTDTDSLFYAIAESETFGASRASAWCSADESHVWEAESGAWRFSGEYVDGSAPDFDFDDAEFSRETETENGWDSTDAPAGTFFCPVDGCSGTVGIQVS